MCFFSQLNATLKYKWLRRVKQQSRVLFDRWDLFLPMNINFHPSLQPLQAVFLSLTHRSISSRPYADCEQLKEDSHCPDSPCVSNTGGLSLTSTNILSSLSSWLIFPIFLLLFGLVIGPSPALKLSPAASLPFLPFYLRGSVVLFWGYVWYSPFRKGF